MASSVSKVTKTLNESHSRIKRRRWLFLARLAWLLVLLITIGELLLQMAYFFADLQTICEANCQLFALTPGLLAEMQAYHLPPAFWASHILILDSILAFVSIAIGILIFLWRSDDWLVLLTSSMTIMLGVIFTLSNSHIPAHAPIAFFRFSQVYSVVAIISSLQFLSVFPSGTYINRYAPYIVLLGIAWEIGRRVFGTVAITSNNVSLLSYLLVSMSIVGAVFWGQVHRYRFVSTPLERQQTKWVVLAAALTIIGFSLSAGLYFSLIPVLSQYFNTLPMNLALRLLYYVSLILLPIGLGISIFRYKIWEADIAIHRTVVFGIISLVLALLFVLSFFLLNNLLNPIFADKSKFIAAGIAILAAALAFQPIRKQVQQFIDQNIYQFRLDLGELAQIQHRRNIVLQSEQIASFPNQALGAYQIEGLIGKGGMGKVYLAVDSQNDREVAVKVLSDLLSGEAEFIQRFIHEAELAKTLSHPNIVNVLDFGKAEQHHYLVMPLVDGKDLSQILKEGGRLSPEKLCTYLKDIAAALSYLHEQGIVHRDIKPANILISENEAAFLTDFGLAKRLDDKSDSEGLMGTMTYIPPEQITNAGTVNERSDIYSLGVSCYELLTGQPPFVGSLDKLVFAHIQQPAPNPRLLAPELPEELAYILMRSLAKEPSDRYPNVDAFYQAFREAI